MFACANSGMLRGLSATPEEPAMDRIHLLAAEIFGYSYANYEDHLGIGNIRFDTWGNPAFCWTQDDAGACVIARHLFGSRARDDGRPQHWCWAPAFDWQFNAKSSDRSRIEEPATGE
jgi:hypothetical protein